MATDSLVDRVRAALADMPEGTEERMFGSIGFGVRGKMCVTARPERIMCRIDPALHEAAVARPGCETVVMKGRPCRGYVYVSVEALPTKRALMVWVRRALHYNATLEK